MQVVEKKLIPTTLGTVVNDLLVAHFPTIVDYNFTAQMEQELDDIAEGERAWVPVVRGFFEPFERTLAHAKEEMRGVKGELITTDLPCPTCGAPLAIKWGKRGEFLACSRHPDCAFTGDLARDDLGQYPTGRSASTRRRRTNLRKMRQAHGPEKKPLWHVPGLHRLSRVQAHRQPAKGERRLVSLCAPAVTDQLCDKCGKPLVQKKGRFGIFLGCSGYPECNNIVNLDRSGQPKAPPQMTAELCPTCGKHMAIKQGRYGPFLSCTGYPACRTLAKLPADGSLPRLLTPDEVAALPQPEPKAVKGIKHGTTPATAGTATRRSTSAASKKAPRTPAAGKAAAKAPTATKAKTALSRVAATTGTAKRPRAVKQPA